MSRSVLALLALALLAPTLAQAAGPRLIQVPVASRADRERIANWGCEVVETTPNSMTLAVHSGRRVSSKLDRALTQMAGAKIVADDADALLAAFRDRPDVGLYHTYEEAKAELQDLATRFPAIASMHDIGKSFEGRETMALRITGSAAAPWGKPVFLFMGCHHAREWISVEVPLAMAKHLVTGYDTDGAIKNLVDTREVWIVPVVNPDGLNYSQSNYKYWRKNRFKNADGSFGVDPNRNYAYKWGTAGDSGDPDSDTYRGTGPFSELDTQHIRDFAARNLLTTSISFHSYGERVMYPFSYGYVQCADNAEFARYAKGMADRNKYVPHQSVDMYPSSGDTDDYLYAEQGSLSFTVEVARTFIPAENQIAGICEANVKAMRWLIENAADPFPFVKHTPPNPVAGPLSITATFDKAHHPTFKPEQVTMVVASGETLQELPMVADPNNPDNFTVEVPRGDSGTLNYFFGLKDKDGRVVRSPRLGTYTVETQGFGPAALLVSPAKLLGF